MSSQKVLSLIQWPALPLSSSHYCNIISCLSSILLSGSLSVRYTSISDMTHIHAHTLRHTKPCLFTEFQNDNYIISTWRASRKVIIRQLFLPIYISGFVFSACATEPAALPCTTKYNHTVLVEIHRERSWWPETKPYTVAPRQQLTYQKGILTLYTYPNQETFCI